MATATDTKKATQSFDTAFEQMREAGDQAFANARKLGNQYLDLYEQQADRAIDLERKLAGSTQQEWMSSMITAHADLARELTDTYTSTARGLLK